MKTKSEDKTMQVVKKGKTQSLSGKSTLVYEIAKDENDAVFLRISSNTGGGFYSGEWVAAKDIEAALSKDPERITSLSLFKLFKNRSVNTPGYILAALKHEGVVQAMKGRQRVHTYVDIGQLTSPGKTSTTKKATTRKKTAPRKRATR